MTDDDTLDLSAWQPPAAPDVTEAVLDQMHHPVAPARPRWWLLGGVAAALAAAAIAIVVLRGGGDPGEDAEPGQLVAERAQHLALAGATVEVERGAELHWRRDRDGLRVTQRGTATWTVADRLRIDAGAASIEATAANLRVEVEMNRQDLQIVSTSALTAAAVALVTIVVYDGHVRATSAGHTITIAPGTTVQVAPDRAPHTVDPVDRAVARCEAAKQMWQWDELASCARALDPVRGQAYAELAAFEKVNQRTYTELVAAAQADDLDTVEARFNSIPDRSVYAALAEPRLMRLRGKHEPCDVAELSSTAGLAYASGNFGAAERDFRLAYKCAPAPRLLSLAYAAACKGADTAGARELYGKLAPDVQARVMQLCLEHDIDPRATPQPAVAPRVKPMQVAPPPNRCQPMGKHDPSSTAPDCGAVDLTCTPVAKVYLDGVDTGRETPTGPIEIAPGKHKVTFRVGDDRFTFAVAVTAGQTVKMSKILQ